MLARSFSLASLLGFVAVLLCAHQAEAAMAQGSLDLVRDWTMQVRTHHFTLSREPGELWRQRER